MQHNSEPGSERSNGRFAPSDEYEDAFLCQELRHPDFRHRYQALDTIIQRERDTLAIARALTTAWCNYAGPAASLLFALDNLYERRPDLFQEDFLPLRRALVCEPLLWRRIQENTTWQAIITVLYLPLGAPFQPDQINRDSPLTASILSALQQPSQKQALRALLDELVPIASQPGTARARDAALLLSSINDTRWVEGCVANTSDNHARLIPLAASLIFAYAHALVRALDLDLAHARDMAMILRSPTYVARSISKRNSGLDRVRTFALGLGPTLKTARNLDIDLIYARDLARTLTHVHDLEQDLDYVQQIEYALASSHRSNAVVDTVQTIRRLLETAVSLSWVWATVMDSIDVIDIGDPWQQ